MPDPSQPCDLAPELTGFDYPLPHLTEALKRQRKIKIVAIGSSSTAGVDRILPYPPRLEMALRETFKGRMIDVLNRGIGGQEAPEELSRFEPDVIAEVPTLVIWQVGTNAIFRNLDYNPDDVATAIGVGLDWLAGLPMDVVLMDLQYTRALVGSDKLGSSEDMVSRISTIGNRSNVNVFRRFALMQRWFDGGIPIESLDDGGELHTSEWATACVTQALFGAITGAPQTRVSSGFVRS
jgi:acyl-CoA thioesterase I